MMIQSIVRLFTPVQKNCALQQELMDMFHNDTGVAGGLLNLEYRMHSGRTEQWYMEKVIYDLGRDR